jgi:3-isopropylmalate dehydrogenase
MLLRYTLAEAELADRVESAVQKVLANGLRTADIAGEGEPTVSTSEMGQAVLDNL